MNDYLGGGGYDGVIPTLPAPAATSYEPKNTLDKAALVNALGPALGALAAYLAGGKYGGVAAGSYASALTQQQQIMEQKKQNEAAQKRQAWLDEMTRVQFEQQQKALQEEQKKQQEEIKWKMGLIDKLSPYAADTPGKMMTVEGSPVTGSWLDTYIPGSFDSGMLDMTLGKGLNNIEGYTTPATYGDPTAKAIMGMAGEGAPDSVYDLAANYLLKQGGVTSSGPKRNKAAFEIFSPDNESAQYAMANWDTLKDDDVDSLFFKAQAEEKEIKKGASGTINWQPVIDAIPDGNKYKANVLALVAAGASDEDIQEQVENANDAIPDADAQEKAALDLQLKKLQIQKAQKDLAGGGGGGTWDPNDIFRGTPFVQSWDKQYKAYTDKTPATLKDDMGGTKPNPALMSIEKFIRSRPGGDKIWAKYAQESQMFGPQYQGEVGTRILAAGGVKKALDQAIKDKASPAVIAELKKRAGDTGSAQPAPKKYTDADLSKIVARSKNPKTGKLGSFEGAMYDAIKSKNLTLINALMAKWDKLHPNEKRGSLYWTTWFTKIYKG